MANQVFVDKVSATIELKNNGIKLRVTTDCRLRGYLRIGRGKLQWSRGKEQKPFLDMTLENFIAWAEEPGNRSCRS